MAPAPQGPSHAGQAQGKSEPHRDRSNGVLLFIRVGSRGGVRLVFRRIDPEAEKEMSLHNTKRLAGCLLMACLILGGCSSLGSGRAFGGKIDFEVEVDGQMNGNHPVAVDFLIVYDQELYQALQGMDAEQWFEGRDQFLADAAPEMLQVHAREWVPGSAGVTETVDHRRGALGGVLFASYFSPGEHRFVVQPLKNFTLKLGESEATIHIGR